ncbi:glycosyl hydrolase [Microbacterium paludicola]|uniref:Glycosyl hydrolase n=1 Tax=Microbacterium paludicola TaxID=300019 RepID=A0A4Y9FNT8_9MICO|nr:glycoside hydrolase family 3 C-terminal domain-containing protein [Microbacterium paludicola]MBF0817702.1 glycoside hydrolase family 3 C-terminal domain-containing protein [Microbacterium paludicola]TFU30190.1 glycosyl hydrolase [Microbacterium paludicola]
MDTPSPGTPGNGPATPAAAAPNAAAANGAPDTAALVASLSLLEKAALLSGADVWRTRGIPRLGVPQIWMSDGPHGLRKQTGSADHLGLAQSEPATCFPTAATVANSWDEALAEDIGRALGREARAQGVHVLLGPGLNIKRSPLGGRNFEYFSEDPELSGRLAAGYVRGIQSQGVAATPKHFAVNSQELRRMVSDSVVDERTLRELYLTAFEIVVREASPWAVMSSYNLVNGVYAHENRELLTDVLREEWGFDGAVISDWGGGNDAVAAVAAGGTIEMPSPGFDSARAIVAAVDAGTLAVADLDARVAEVLSLVLRVTAAGKTEPIDVDAHHALARQAAAESAVLLRNESQLLPLAAGTRVALIGDFAETPRYQGSGSSAVNPTRLTNLRDAIANTGLTLEGFAAGYTRRGSETEDAVLRGVATALAARADVAVMALGLPESDESEGLDRTHLHLPDTQLAALRAVAATGTPVVVVLAGGGAIETPWLDHTAAVLHAYLGGQAGAEGIWDVLTGAVEPGGRLAETFPRQLQDDPLTGRFPAQGPTAQYREGMFSRYRYYATAGVDPAFPLGFGLSYTTFSYGDLRVTAEGATFTVTNTGTRAGVDVPQLYVRRTSDSAVPRPALELKGFRKLRLEPGASETVTVPFTERTFRFWDTANGAWQVEAGSYEILVGSHSAALILSAPLEVTGTVPSGAPVPALADYSRGEVRAVPDAAFAALLGRPVPADAWGRGPLVENTPMDQLGRARSGLARLAFRFLESRKRAADAKGEPDLNILFVYNAPFRIIHKMSGGMATRRVTDGVLTVINGRPFAGLGRAIGGYFRGRRDERRTARAFTDASEARVDHQDRRPR